MKYLNEALSWPLPLQGRDKEGRWQGLWLGGHGPRHHRLGRAVQGAETRWLSFRREPRDPLARRGHTRGIDEAELGRHEKRAARGRSNLGKEAPLPMRPVMTTFSNLQDLLRVGPP